MASSWIEKRSTGDGTRYRVRFRLGGAESVPKLAGTFGTLREARARRDWVLGELAGMRVPDLETLAAHTPPPRSPPSRKSGARPAWTWRMAPPQRTR
jgi:hypothetical protein